MLSTDSLSPEKDFDYAIDESVHRREWEISRRKHPKLFDASFSRHMKKIEERNKARRKQDWIEGKYRIRVSDETASKLSKWVKSIK